MLNYLYCGNHFATYTHTMGFPGGSDGKESACNVRNMDSIPRLGRSLGEGNGYSLQYSCLENSMDRVWWAIVHGVANSQTQLSMHTKENLNRVKPVSLTPTYT